MSSPHLPPEDRAARTASSASTTSGSDPRQGGEMPFMQHLEELRGVLQHSLVAHPGWAC